MIYKPNNNLVGVDERLASHMDIFPTVADLINYQSHLEAGEEA